jgi:endogenous inhibitor of DNA gyrase (YacG/DUF329 family)
VSGRARSERAEASARPKSGKRAKCPICGKPAVPDYRPFCSKPCADIDLGRWLGGRYVVPGEAAKSDAEERED